MVENEKGLTLVEVLAALVILGIVFVSIMTIFPQMTLFNAKTETKLDTMNLARQEMAEITEKSQWIGKLDTDSSCNSGLTPETAFETFGCKVPEVLESRGYTATSKSADLITYEKQQDYRYEADISLQCELYSNETSETVNCDDPDRPQLYSVHLKIYNGSQLSSETYSYITYTVESTGGAK